MSPSSIAQLAALASGLSLLGIMMQRRAFSRLVMPNVAQDLAHVAFRAAIGGPCMAAMLLALDAAVDRWAPTLRIDLLHGLPTLAQFVVYVVLVDLLDYGVHRLFHRVPALWQLHAIHHSQTWVNPLTTTRTHPLEIAVKRLLTWAPLVFLGAGDQPWPLWIAIDGFWGFFVHSDLHLPFGPLRHVVVTPAFHRVHHSRALAHRDTNFGERLVLWDALFGTARHDETVTATGIDDMAFPSEDGTRLTQTPRTWWAQFVHPLRRRSPRGRRRPMSELL